MATFDLELPDGTVLKDIPEGTTKTQIERKLRDNGMAVPQKDTWGNAIRNVVDAGLKAGSGIVAGVAGDAAGLTALGVDALGGVIGRDPGTTADPTRVRNAVSNALTYTPHNPQSLASKIVDAPGRVMGAASEGLTNLADKSGLPYVGAVAGAIPAVAANVLGAKGMRGARADAALERVPTTPELHAAATQAYKEAKLTGEHRAVPAEKFAETLDSLAEKTREFGIDPDLTPKSAKVVQRLEEMRGKPLTLDDAHRLRRIASNATGDVHPNSMKPTADAHLAQKIVDHLDDHLDEIVGEGPAREVWSRYRRSEMLDEMQRRAEIQAGANYTISGLENALRTQYKQLALNPRRMKYLTPEMRAAVEKVAKGGAIENSLRNLGKMSPFTGGLPGMIAGAGGAGAAIAGNPYYLAVAGAGTVAKPIATALTKANVANARTALVGRGLPGQAPPLVGANVGAGQLGAGIAAGQSDFDRRYEENLARLRAIGAPSPVPQGAAQAPMQQPAPQAPVLHGRGPLTQSNPQGPNAQDVLTQVLTQAGLDPRLAANPQMAVRALEQKLAEHRARPADSAALVAALRRGRKPQQKAAPQLSGPQLDAMLEQLMAGAR